MAQIHAYRSRIHDGDVNLLPESDPKGGRAQTLWHHALVPRINKHVYASEMEVAVLASSKNCYRGKISTNP